MRIETVMCAAAGMAMAGGAMAGPPNADVIGSEARVMVHLDLEAMNKTTLGDWFMSQAEAGSNNFEDIQQLFPGFSLRDEGGIGSVTAYATGLTDEGPEGLIVIVRGNENLSEWNQNLTGMLAQQGSEPATIAGHSALVIPMDEETGFLTLLDQGEDGYAWVLGLSASSLTNALAVIEGNAEAIGEEARTSIGSTWGKGSIAMIGTSELGLFEEFKPASMLLSMADQVWIRLGERGGEVEAQLLVHPQNGEHAQKLSKVFNGIVAFGTLMQSDNEELEHVMELINALDIDDEDGALSVSFEYDVDTVIEMIEAQQEAKYEEAWIEIEGEIEEEAEAEYEAVTEDEPESDDEI